MSENADAMVCEDGSMLAMDGKLPLERAKELASILNDSARDIGERLAAGSELGRHLEPLEPQKWRPPLAGMGDEG